MRVSVKRVLNDLKLLEKRAVYDKGFKALMDFAPAVDGVTLYENVAYLPDGNQWHCLDVHVPQEGTGPFPCIIYLHGGGWSNVDKSVFHHYCSTVAGQGFVVFNADYRLAPDYRFPAQIEDAAQALSWVRDNAALYQGNPDQIFLVGDSAGAHLSALLACACADPAFAGRIGLDQTVRGIPVSGTGLLCGAFDLSSAAQVRSPNISGYLLGLFGVGELSEITAEQWDLISPARHITPGFPPSFLTHARADGLFPQSVALAGELERNRVRHTCLFLDERDNAYFHDYQMVYFFPVYKKSIRAMTDFFHGCLDADSSALSDSDAERKALE